MVDSGCLKGRGGKMKGHQLYALGSVYIHIRRPGSRMSNTVWNSPMDWWLKGWMVFKVCCQVGFLCICLCRGTTPSDEWGHVWGRSHPTEIKWPLPPTNELSVLNDKWYYSCIVSSTQLMSRLQLHICTYIGYFSLFAVPNCQFVFVLAG